VLPGGGAGLSLTQEAQETKHSVNGTQSRGWQCKLVAGPVLVAMGLQLILFLKILFFMPTHVLSDIIIVFP
jgi:hypothetical protein